MILKSDSMYVPASHWCRLHQCNTSWYITHQINFYAYIYVLILFSIFVVSKIRQRKKIFIVLCSSRKNTFFYFCLSFEKLNILVYLVIVCLLKYYFLLDRHLTRCWIIQCFLFYGPTHLKENAAVCGCSNSCRTFKKCFEHFAPIYVCTTVQLQTF